LAADDLRHGSRRCRTGPDVVFLGLWFGAPLNNAFWDLVFWISNALGVNPHGFEGSRIFRILGT